MKCEAAVRADFAYYRPRGLRLDESAVRCERDAAVTVENHALCRHHYRQHLAGTELDFDARRAVWVTDASLPAGGYVCMESAT